MHLHRFIVDSDINSQEIVIKDKDIIHQIHNVLRLRIGDPIIVCDGQGNEVLTKIILSDKNSIVAHPIELVKNVKSPKIETLLYCSLLKRQNFELVAQKATEVGIETIVPMITKRTVKLGFNYFRIHNIIKEAAEQCGRGDMPLLCHPMEFEEAVIDAVNNSINYFFEIAGKMFNAKNITFVGAKKIGIFIGPEGGWEEKEIRLAQEKGFNIVSLGNFTFRSETAAIIASYVIESNFL